MKSERNDETAAQAAQPSGTHDAVQALRSLFEADGRLYYDKRVQDWIFIDAEADLAHDKEERRILDGNRSRDLLLDLLTIQDGELQKCLERQDGYYLHRRLDHLSRQRGTLRYMWSGTFRNDCKVAARLLPDLNVLDYANWMVNPSAQPLQWLIGSPPRQ